MLTWLIDWLVIYYIFLFSPQALCGATLQLPTIEGGKVALTLTDITKPHTVKRIPGKGLPIPKEAGKRGDLIVKFDIVFPDALPPSAKEVLRDLLPASWACVNRTRNRSGADDG